MDEFKVGDFAIHIQPDSIVPERWEFAFLWEGREFEAGQVPLKYRRITVRRFRKEWSEGLICPIKMFGAYELPDGRIKWYDEQHRASYFESGEDVSEFLNITHYEPEEQTSLGTRRNLQYKFPPKTLKGWWYWLLGKLGLDPLRGENERGPSNPPPIYDVEGWKNFKDELKDGEEVYVTEKIHGSNARFVFDGKKFYVGSRKLWKSKKSKDVWRAAVQQHPGIEEWCRAHPNYTLYGEVVPTQGEKFRYGTQGNEIGVFFFDVLQPDGKWMPAAELRKQEVNLVPLLYKGPFDLEKIKTLVDGTSAVVGASNIREGVVIRPEVEREARGLGRVLLKIVSNKFLEAN